MTIEEYLRKRIEDLEEGPCNSSLVQGKILAYRELLEKLPSFEHEVTLREVHEMCLEHDCNCISKGKECCLFDDNYCMVNDVSPNNMDVDEIEKRMKEARND